MPDIAAIQHIWFSQATEITDRNGEVLYKLYDENRDYIAFEDISSNFVNAIISVEDQRFWTNPWIDVFGIIRAWIRDVSKWDSHGASTITQQLIKNMLLTSEKKVSRKLKEIFLAMTINDYIGKDISKKYNNLNQQQQDRKTKEKIFELYANYIFFWNNAYGIETAAKTYFWISAKELNLVQSSILASLPKAPSRFDPYTNKDQLVGVLSIIAETSTEENHDAEAKGQIFWKIEAELQKAKIEWKKNETDILNYLWWLFDFTYQVSGINYNVDYTPWRKDIVLARMFVDKVITEKQFKDAIFEWFGIQFNHTKTDIIAPHFVFWVINQLEQQFDSEVLRKGWLTIKTTLDLKTQKLAEEAINENDSYVTSYWATNSSMLYVDSQQWDVLAYVWSKDYYNKAIWGENDLVQRARQPGSTIKPLLYALGFMKIAMGIDSPIYDLSMTIADNTPSNADEKFNGLMSIKTALAASRNIPAIKMFLMVWWEIPFKEFLNTLGVESLDMKNEIYGYPLAIWAGEIPMIQMVKAYTHLSAWGKPALLNPILEITNPSGDILYKKKVEKAKEIIPPWVAYLLWNILSNLDNMPASWRQTFNFPAVKFATKSGTTNGVYGDKKLPRDGWFVAYTPSKVMMFRWWNNDGKPLKETAYGGWLNAPIWRSFSNKLVKNKLISNESMDEIEIKKIALSKLSGKLASSNTPLAFITNSLAYIGNLPNDYDAWAKTIEIDGLCNGVISDATTSWDIRKAYIIYPTTIMPDKRDQNDVLSWWWGGGLQAFASQISGSLFLSEKSIWWACTWERNLLDSVWEISLNLLQPSQGQTVTRSFSVWHQTKSPFSIESVSFYLNDVVVKTNTYNTTNVIDISKIQIPESLAVGTYTLKVVVKDVKWFTDSKSVPIVLVDNDTTAPVLLKEKISIEKIIKNTTTVSSSWSAQSSGVLAWTLVESGSNAAQTISYKVTLFFSDSESIIKEGSILQWWKVLADFSSNVVSFIVSSLNDISYVITDSSWNTWKGLVSLASQ